MWLGIGLPWIFNKDMNKLTQVSMWKVTQSWMVRIGQAHIPFVPFISRQKCLAKPCTDHEQQTDHQHVVHVV